MKETLLYHHNDNDGILSAVIVSEYLLKTKSKSQITFLSGNYREDNSPLLAAFGTMWLLDYSLPYDQMQRFADRMIWIDHHKAAIDEMAGLDIAGVRNTAESGCMLTWKYCYPDAPAPLVVRLVEDRDLWRFFWARTRAFHEISRLHFDDREWWRNVLNDTGYAEAEIDRGMDLMQYGGKIATSLGKWRWEARIDGIPCIMLNASTGIPFITESRGNVIRVYFHQVDGDTVKFELRGYDGSPHDLGVLAKKFGGGGHHDAAGFHMAAKFAYPMIVDKEIVPCDNQG